MGAMDRVVESPSLSLPPWVPRAWPDLQTCYTGCLLHTFSTGSKDPASSQPGGDRGKRSFASFRIRPQSLEGMQKLLKAYDAMNYFAESGGPDMPSEVTVAKK